MNKPTYPLEFLLDFKALLNNFKEDFIFDLFYRRMKLI